MTDRTPVNARTCDECMYYAITREGDDAGEHHPACTKAPETDRNEFGRLFASMPRRSEPKEDPAEKAEAKRDHWRRFKREGSRNTWGYAGPRR